MTVALGVAFGVAEHRRCQVAPSSYVPYLAVSSYGGFNKQKKYGAVSSAAFFTCLDFMSGTRCVAFTSIALTMPTLWGRLSYRYVRRTARQKVENTD